MEKMFKKMGDLRLRKEDKVAIALTAIGCALLLITLTAPPRKHIYIHLIGGDLRAL